MTPQVLIVGAGIGGLTAARALHMAGLEVRVVERAPRLEVLGAGIGLWPNAVRILEGLGAGQALARAGGPTSDAGIRRYDGELLASLSPAAIQRRYGAPLLMLHRATLQRALLEDGIEDLVETGVEVTGIDQGEGRVAASTKAGDVLRADVLIGADGIRSAVRAALLGDEPLRRSGLLAYRGVVDLPQGQVLSGEYWGAGGVFGLVPIDGNRLYWYATRRTSGEEAREEDPIPALLRRYRDWAPELCRVIAATPSAAVLRHDLYDRKPTAPWARGQVALLGDAAHPMLPFLGQGACQAIEDAHALQQALTSRPSVPDALLHYEKKRRRSAVRVVKQSRRLGPIVHLRSAPLRAVRNRVLATTPEALRLRQLDPIIGRGSA